jgi:hypothetical protein
MVMVQNSEFISSIFKADIFTVASKKIKIRLHKNIIT